MGKLRASLLFLASWLAGTGILCAHEEPVVLQLKWTHAFQFAGYYAAIEQGYYREAGIDVKLLQGGPEVDFAQELSSGRAQYAVALSSMIVHRVQGAPVVALAAIFQHSPEVLLTLKSAGINNPHQLAGKTVMVSAEDTPAILAMFKNEGLQSDAVNIIPYQFDYSLFENGKIDAMASYVTNEPYYFSRRGVEVVEIQPRNYGVDFYGDCLFTSEQELKEHPKRVKAFREASLRGWQYAMQHREEVIELIIKKYPTQMTREAMQYEAGKMEELMFSNLIPIGHMNEGRWRHIGDTYVRLGILPADYEDNLGNFIYNPDGDGGAGRRWLWGVVGLSSLATLVLSAVVLSLMWVNRKITVAEHEAKEARNILQTVLDTIPVGVFWKDRESRYIGCNRVFAEYAGLTSSAHIKGLRDDDLPWSEGLKNYEQSDREVLETGTPMVRYEEQVPLKTGGVDTYLKSKSPLRDSNGKIIGVLGVAENISAIKHSEEKRLEMIERVQQAEKFESLSRLIGGLSHHFNNILQSVVINADLAARPVPAGHPIKESLDVVLREIRRAMEISKVLLSTVGRGSFAFKTVPLDEMLEKIFPVLQETVSSKQEVRLNLRSGITPVEVDFQSLQLLLVNLVSNASEALGEAHAVIQVESGRFMCDRAYLSEPYLPGNLEEGEYACIDVVDQGPGMSEGVRKKVFDPFFSTKFEGRGLGMAVVLGVVRSHRGAVKITSTSGKGTTIRILLPIKPADSSRQ